MILNIKKLPDLYWWPSVCLKSEIYNVMIGWGRGQNGEDKEHIQNLNRAIYQIEADMWE